MQSGSECAGLGNPGDEAVGTSATDSRCYDRRSTMRGRGLRSRSEEFPANGFDEPDIVASVSQTNTTQTTSAASAAAAQMATAAVAAVVQEAGQHLFGDPASDDSDDESYVTASPSRHDSFDSDDDVISLYDDEGDLVYNDVDDDVVAGYGDNVGPYFAVDRDRDDDDDVSTEHGNHDVSLDHDVDAGLEHGDDVRPVHDDDVRPKHDVDVGPEHDRDVIPERDGDVIPRDDGGDDYEDRSKQLISETGGELLKDEVSAQALVMAVEEDEDEVDRFGDDEEKEARASAKSR